MYAVMNELSFNLENSEVSEKEIARDKISEFVRTLMRVKNIKKFEGFVTTKDIYQFHIFADYGIREWLNDPLVEKRNQTSFRAIINKNCSFINSEEYTLEELKISLERVEHSSLGCLVAVMLNERVVSLNSRRIWDNEVIDGLLLTIDENEEISEEIVVVSNISKEFHVTRLEGKVVDESISMLSSGQDLWERREELFPNLIFCDRVKRQLYTDPEMFHIKQVAKKLKRMQEYFSEDNAVYRPNKLGLGARTESDTVKNSAYLSSFRVFEKPDGTKSYFYDHISFPGRYSGRIHFLPDCENKKCYIGHIGEHLETKNF